MFRVLVITTVMIVELNQKLIIIGLLSIWLSKKWLMTLFKFQKNASHLIKTQDKPWVHSTNCVYTVSTTFTALDVIKSLPELVQREQTFMIIRIRSFVRWFGTNTINTNLWCNFRTQIEWIIRYPYNGEDITNSALYSSLRAMAQHLHLQQNSTGRKTTVIHFTWSERATVMQQIHTLYLHFKPKTSSIDTHIVFAEVSSVLEKRLNIRILCECGSFSKRILVQLIFLHAIRGYNYFPESNLHKFIVFLPKKP